MGRTDGGQATLGRGTVVPAALKQGRTEPLPQSRSQHQGPVGSLSGHVLCRSMCTPHRAPCASLPSWHPATWQVLGLISKAPTQNRKQAPLWGHTGCTQMLKPQGRQGGNVSRVPEKMQGQAGVTPLQSVPCRQTCATITAPEGAQGSRPSLSHIRGPHGVGLLCPQAHPLLCWKPTQPCPTEPSAATGTHQHPSALGPWSLFTEQHRSSARMEPAPGGCTGAGAQGLWVSLGAATGATLWPGCTGTQGGGPLRPAQVQSHGQALPGGTLDLEQSGPGGPCRRVCGLPPSCLSEGHLASSELLLPPAPPQSLQHHSLSDNTRPQGLGFSASLATLSQVPSPHVCDQGPPVWQLHSQEAVGRHFSGSERRPAPCECNHHPSLGAPHNGRNEKKGRRRMGSRPYGTLAVSGRALACVRCPDLGAPESQRGPRPCWAVLGRESPVQGRGG